MIQFINRIFTTGFIVLLFTVTVKGQFRDTISTSIGKISFDKSITGYKFGKLISGRYTYSVNGPKDFTNNKFPIKGFAFYTHDSMDYELGVSFVMMISSDMSKENPELMEKSLKDTIINVDGHKAFCSFFSLYDKKGIKRQSIFTGIVANGSNGVVFVSSDDEKALLIKKYFDTFKSLRF